MFPDLTRAKDEGYKVIHTIRVKMRWEIHKNFFLAGAF